MRDVNAAVWVAASAACLCALAVFAILARMAAHYVPFDHTALQPIVFVHYRLPGIQASSGEIALSVGLWSAALLAMLSLSLRRAEVRTGTAVLVAMQALLLAIFALGPLPLDSDQFAYAGYGAAVLHGANPYKPAPLPANASLAQRRVAAHWHDPLVPDRYGPVWTLLNAGILAPVQRASLEAQTLTLRCWAAIAATICSLLIAQLLRGKRLQNVAVAAFALSPLVVLESANGAHNDVFMVLFALAALVALQREWFFTAAVLLGLAIGSKFAYGPLALPFLAYVYARTRRPGAVLIAMLNIAAPIVLCAMFFGLRASLIAPVLSATHAGSVPSQLPFLQPLGKRTVDTLLFAAIVAGAAFAARQILRRRQASASLIVTIALTWLAADKLEPWYGFLATPLLLAGDPGIAVFFGITSGSLVILYGSLLGTLPSVTALEVAGAVTALAYVLLKGNDRPSPSPRIRDVRSLEMSGG
jgi:hypothetical protein